MDFGVSIKEETLASSYTLSPEFMRVATMSGLAVTVSVYKVE
jgi:hypothetical protein